MVRTSVEALRTRKPATLLRNPLTPHCPPQTLRSRLHPQQNQIPTPPEEAQTRQKRTLDLNRKVPVSGFLPKRPAGSRGFSRRTNSCTSCLASLDLRDCVRHALRCLVVQSSCRRSGLQHEVSIEGSLLSLSSNLRFWGFSTSQQSP